jgi:hypothetical protein
MTWYRRREQPLRIAMWYGTNGVASMLGSLLAWALSFIVSPVLYVYQILFLTVGLATVITAPRTSTLFQLSDMWYATDARHSDLVSLSGAMPAPALLTTLAGVSRTTPLQPSS